MGFVIDLTGSVTFGSVIDYMTGSLLNKKKPHCSLAVSGGSGLCLILIGKMLMRSSSNHFINIVNNYNSEIGRN